MKRLLLHLWQQFIHGEPAELLDHVPVSGRRDYRKKLTRALLRHGKPFRSHTKVQRVEPPSRTLIELEQTSTKVEPSANVRPLPRARAKSPR